MRTHTKTFHIRFTEKEYERLCKHAKKSGLPKSTYIRFMIRGCSPKEQPTDMIWALLKEIHFIGNNLNQLTQLAHRTGSLHAGKLNGVLEEYRRIYLEIYNEIMLPAPVVIPEVLERGRQLVETELSKEEMSHAER